MRLRAFTHLMRFSRVYWLGQHLVDKQQLEHRAVPSSADLVGQKDLSLWSATAAGIRAADALDTLAKMFDFDHLQSQPDHIEDRATHCMAARKLPPLTGVTHVPVPPHRRGARTEVLADLASDQPSHKLGNGNPGFCRPNFEPAVQIGIEVQIEAYRLSGPVPYLRLH